MMLKKLDHLPSGAMGLIVNYYAVAGACLRNGDRFFVLPKFKRKSFDRNG